MARDLPYLKFNAAEYLNGEITLEDFYTQGVFINICALYWFKSGCLTLTEIKRRLKCKQSSIDRLIETNIVKVSEDHVRITFLDEQLHERGNVSKINSINGSLGGAPKGNSNARKAENNKQETTEKQPKTTNIEENRREERRTEENGAGRPASLTIDDRSKNFMTKIAVHLEEYPKEMLREFYDYWTESNEGGRKMKFEMQKTFDIQKRLAKWASNQKTKPNGHSKDKREQHIQDLATDFAAKYGTGNPIG